MKSVRSSEELTTLCFGMVMSCARAQQSCGLLSRAEFGEGLRRSLFTAGDDAAALRTDMYRRFSMRIIGGSSDRAGLRHRCTMCDVPCFRQIGAVLIALSFLGVPALACLLPDAQLTAEERECCKHMAEMCGSAGMPASHSCCAPAARAVNHALPSGTICVSAPVVSTVALPAPAPSLSELRTRLSSLAESPPGSPPDTTLVLRI